MVAEVEENNLGYKAFDERWMRWHTCSLCEQSYHGVVSCALGWACWKTYVGRPETNFARRLAISVLGNGLYDADHHEEALSVKEAELSIERRLGTSEHNMLFIQGNIANTYKKLGRIEEAVQMKRDTYSGWLRLNGEEHKDTLKAAMNYASSLNDLRRFEEAKSLLRKTIPVARRVLGESNETTIMIRWHYARALALDSGPMLDDLREAVTTLEDIERIARRVLGGAHPATESIGSNLREVRAELRAREAQSGEA